MTGRHHAAPPREPAPYTRIARGTRRLATGAILLTLAAAAVARTVPFHLQLVDAECRPVPGHSVAFIESRRASGYYGVGKRNTVEQRAVSDADGRLELRIDPESVHLRFVSVVDGREPQDMPLLREFSIHDFIWHDRGRNYPESPLAPLARTTLERPLKLYPDLQRRTRDDAVHRIGTLQFGQVWQRLELPWQIGGGNIASLRYRLVDGVPRLELRAEGPSGVVRVADIDGTDDLASLTGHAPVLAFDLPPGRTRHVFHLFGPDQRWSTQISLEALLGADGRTAHYALSADTRVPRDIVRPSASDPSVGSEPVRHHPVERCGGVMDRSPTGALASLTTEILAFLRSRMDGSLPGSTPVALAMALEKRLADPALSLDEVSAMLPPRDDLAGLDRNWQARLYLAAIDNNAPVPGRHALVYDAAREYRFPDLLRRLAGDPRTPLPILEAIWAAEPGLAPVLIANPGIDEAFVSRLLDDAESGAGEKPAWGAEAARHPSAGPATHERLIRWLESGTEGLRDDATPPDALTERLIWAMAPLADRPDLRDDHRDRITALFVRLDDVPVDAWLVRRLIDNAQFRNTWRQQLDATLSTSAPTHNQKRRIARVWEGFLASGQPNPAERKTIEAWMRSAGLSNIAVPWRLPEHERQRSLERVLGKDWVEPPDGAPYFDPAWSDDRRHFLAGNLAAPPAILAGLFEHDPRERIIKALAGHPNTPARTLDTLADTYWSRDANPSPSPWIATGLYCNPNFPDARRGRLPYRMDTDCEAYRLQTFR
ncbi:MAG: hypothetical protein KDH20_05025 [Rhodocyclaceae bacterium]|nr:hypothetical protein [Rhodocyclaceae bacterium]